MKKGTIKNPYRNWQDIAEGIIGRTNCILYVFRTFDLPFELVEQLRIRNITLSEKVGE